MNKAVPPADSPLLNTYSMEIPELLKILGAAVSLRVQHVRHPLTLLAPASKIAILFSGGLDCTLLARLAHEIDTSGPGDRSSECSLSESPGGCCDLGEVQSQIYMPVVRIG